MMFFFKVRASRVCLTRWQNKAAPVNISMYIWASIIYTGTKQRKGLRCLCYWCATPV